MGTFLGHILTGTFFICFGLWWVTMVFIRFFKSRRNTRPRGHGAIRGATFRNSSTQPCSCLPTRCCPDLPIEGMIKVIFTVIGTAGEINSAFVRDKYIFGQNNVQHTTMYGFFGLSGVIDILCHYRMIAITGLDYLCLALAFAAEALILYTHQHGGSMLMVYLHQLLVIPIVACFVTTIVEMCFPFHPTAALCRSFFTVVQGTWLWQIAFVLYPPSPRFDRKWNQNDHGDMVLTTDSFTWHLAATFIVITVIGLVVHVIVRHSTHNSKDADNDADSTVYVHINSLESDIEVESSIE